MLCLKIELYLSPSLHDPMTAVLAPVMMILIKVFLTLLWFGINH